MLLGWCLKTAVQWAAVRTWVVEMRVPPQKGVRPLGPLTSPTCQGYSLASVVCPPTILSLPPFTPHWQVEGATGAAVVVVVDTSPEQEALQ